VVRGTEISAANILRILGGVEPGQCVIIEDEADKISNDLDKIRILKSGYEYNGKVPRINMNTKEQPQNWYYVYCYKMVISEKSLNPLSAQGLQDRIFTANCRHGSIKYFIKVVSENINKSKKLTESFKELLDFRKLMLCYRLVHYRDPLSKITINLKNRDYELCYPLLQLFYGTESLAEIKDALQVFLNQRNNRKSKRIESTLFPIIKELVNIHGVKIKFSDIWTIILNTLEGHFDPQKPNQFETDYFGLLNRNTTSTMIRDIFGAELKKEADGSYLIFDKNKLEEFDNYMKINNVNYIEMSIEDDNEKKE
jgi:hypothetical protein